MAVGECFLTGRAAEVTTLSETLMSDDMNEIYPAASIAAE